ncbi:MAG: leucine-rich repeat domain-containing protein [Ferruginibacter sp.]
MDTGHWWQQLETQWKEAFAECYFKHNNEPTPMELEQLYSGPAIRLAGPSAPYPNMSFELSNLSGLVGLENLRVVVVTHQLIETITELETLPQLTSLFLFNNKITSLAGIGQLTELSQLFVQCNKLASITEVRNLVNLKELHIYDNIISSLEGLTEEHADKLERFFCKPNDQLKSKELLRIEREMGIRCLSA